MAKKKRRGCVGIKRLEKIISRLREVKRTSTMEDADFNSFNYEKVDFPQANNEITGFIRKRTELWRRSWITEPLNEVIEILEQFV